MKKIAVMQPYLFPYLGYFQLIENVDEFIFFDNVNFQKKGWMNRNRLRDRQSDVIFSMPLKNASQNKFINETLISDLAGFERMLLQKISHYYRKATYYNYVKNLLLGMFRTFEGKTLSDFNTFTTKNLANELGITTEFIYSSNLSFNLDGVGQEKIISICKTREADIYLNLPGGFHLYDNTAFTENNLNLEFIDVNPFSYDQGYKNFIPGLSVIDYLCHCGPKTWSNHYDEQQR